MRVSVICIWMLCGGVFVGSPCPLSLTLGTYSQLIKCATVPISSHIAFLPRSKRLLISWLQSPSAVILEPKKIKSVPVSIVCPCVCHEVMGLDAVIIVFRMLSFKSTFSLSSLIKRLFSSSSLSAIRMVSSAYLHFS